MSGPRYYLTTPIYYVNDVPHVGHAYTTIAADAVTRARKLRGYDAFMLTGTDEHGQNIERIARERGIPEQQHCDEIAAVFKGLWERLDIGYNRFIRTTDEIHRRGVLKLWKQLVNAKTPDGREAVYRGKYAGWYCPRCEAFKDEEELKQPGNICPDHERPCEWTEEENFFFRLSSYETWLREEIQSGRLRIDPEARRNEVLGIVKQGLKDFSVSRARVKWGIPVPEQPDHVLYVWVDALSNYITALGFADDAPEYRNYWEGAVERLHLLGKDIIRFHCLYWPAILHAAGVAVPTRVFAQGWMTRDGRKLSKTTGNVIVPDALIDRLGSDAVRYFLLREATYGQDWDFTEKAFVGRYNSDLANDLGNLVSRSLTMVQKYCGGHIPDKPVPVTTIEMRFEEDLQLPGSTEHRTRVVLDKYEALDFSGALFEVWSWIGQLNQSIVSVAPWEVARDKLRKPELDAFLYRLLEAVRLVAVMASPVVPRATSRILAMLGAGPELGPSSLEWGVLEPGSAIGAVEPLFPRVETTLETKENTVSDTNPAAPAAPATPAPATEKIDISDFAKVELRAARILEAEKVAGSKKLVRLQVDLGDEKRQVVAGIAESYAPESLVGLSVVIVANLKPAKLMGVESNGMVLAGSEDGKAVLCTFASPVPPGTKVK
jgi:methionyl-tRNA synthetase